MGLFSRRGPIRAVFFDLGGTLIDERDPHIWVEEAQALGLTLDSDALVHWYGEVEAEYDRSGAAWSHEELWQRVLDGAWGGHVDPGKVRAFLERLKARPASSSLYSDVRWCLGELKRRGLALGIISNSRSEHQVREILKHNGLERTFSVVVSSGTEGVAKPDPEIFRRAVARIKVAAGEAFYVGNLPTVDAKAALSAGLHALWLNRGGTGFGTDPPEITSLSEVPHAVKMLTVSVK
jgi:putative hydrolase of the HAD superfamily